MRQRIAAAAGTAGIATLLGAKFYVGEKYLAWRRRRKQFQQGVGVGPKTFARLSRRRQASILGYRRSQVRDFERIYGVQGLGRRRRKLGL